ncbi:folate-binding protein YgfZ [Breoghania sp.]|uniref:CAF17-like 4Fe-4S cluster assembly/insertion protein YgfZ n=1 Tax=Breoghania sp. TaxID=2065378 RepID=UPI002AA917A7|nr:folate-binding protein YgfZ [Breoghania sp.]
MSSFISPLPSRGVVRISGEGAEHFLQGLITCDVEHLADFEGRYGALLTPQGKILFDFLLTRQGDTFLFDLPAPLLADFIKRMTLYKLRAKVEIENLSETHRVFVLWGDAAQALSGAGSFADPRHVGLGIRLIQPTGDTLPDGFESGTEDDWQAHRITLGIPGGGLDFEYGQAFPHDADVDQLSGIAFDKGCYVGQEVVSRMRHRGTARKRIVRVTGRAELPAAGTAITAGGKPAGTLGSHAGSVGLALVRIDRIGNALRNGEPIEADGAPVDPAIPDWASFDWPTDPASDSDA